MTNRHFFDDPPFLAFHFVIVGCDHMYLKPKQILHTNEQIKINICITRYDLIKVPQGANNLIQ
jgi:hypothetical protein